MKSITTRPDNVGLGDSFTVESTPPVDLRKSTIERGAWMKRQNPSQESPISALNDFLFGIFHCLTNPVAFDRN